MAAEVSLMIVSLVLICALLGAFGQVFFKLGSEKFSLTLEGILLNWKFLLGACLYVLSALLFVYALKFGDLSILYPIIATSYIWVALFSFFFLHEPFSWLNLAGVGAILLGIALVVR
jgi:drug/metabolite transporter (DMT)-like permease